MFGVQYSDTAYNPMQLIPRNSELLRNLRAFCRFADTVGANVCLGFKAVLDYIIREHLTQNFPLEKEK